MKTLRSAGWQPARRLTTSPTNCRRAAATLTIYPMNSRLLVSFLLGAWFAGLGIIELAERRAVRTVDASIASAPDPAGLIARAAGAENTRSLVLHHALEWSRSLRGDWEKAQMAMGLLLF